jgi:hypothetical protein
MIRRMVEFFLGPLGMQVLAFYVEHSLIINSAVVLYGLVLTLAHLNLRRIESAALRLLQAEAAGRTDQDPPLAPGGGLAWEKVIAQASFFPLVARGTSLLPRRTHPAALRALCPASDLAARLEQQRPRLPDDREAKP